MENDQEHLKVAIRVRPILPIDGASTSIISITEVIPNQKKTIQVIDSDHYIRSTYDQVFDESSTQEEIYEFVSPALSSTLKGFNCTIFAYGQTGTGKTYTMFGSGDSAFYQSPTRGLIPHSIEKIFQDSIGKSLTYYCSFIQIYNEHLFDLLQDPKRDKVLRIRENKFFGIFVEGLAEFVAENSQDCALLINKGEQNRAVRQTRFNMQSSRSHTLFQMLIESDKANKRGALKKAKINFCDLAGSEKYDKQGVMAVEHIKELTQINKSLTALGKVIHALGTGNVSHVPYRDSKLTRLLQDSLGVNTRTILIATVSPVDQYVEETISTLKFADRAKQVMVKVKKNEISATNDVVITKLQKEIQHLKTLLNLKRKGGLQELEQRIWRLTEENQKLKTIHHNVTIEEVERLKEENKRLRIELQNIGTQGNSDGFFVMRYDESQKPETDKGSDYKSSYSRSSSRKPFKESAGQAIRRPCDDCGKSGPCEHSSPMPKAKLTQKSQSGLGFSQNYRSGASSLVNSVTPTHKSPDLPKRMNMRYRVNNVVVDNPAVNDEIKEAEARKKELRSIQARLNKIAEIEIYRKEQFRKELRNLEENKRKAEEDAKKKAADDSKKRREAEEKRKVVEEFKQRKKIEEELENLRNQVARREAENRRIIENELKKKKIAEYHSNKKAENSESSSDD
jgi:hypothetical protein